MSDMSVGEPNVSSCANCAALLEVIKAYAERCERLEARVRELEFRLAQNSSNSSRPPSSDTPANQPKRKPPTPPSGRRPGGQPGHKGRTRRDFPPEQVDVVIDVLPQECTGCGRHFAEDHPFETFDVHQVAELPKVKPFVTEFRFGRRECPCGHSTDGTRPAHVPAGHLGPRALGTIAALTARCRLSRRQVVETVAELFGLGISVGTVQKTVEQAGDAVAPTVEDIAFEIAASGTVNADESGWRNHGKKWWLWFAASLEAMAELFIVANNRGRPAMLELLPDTFDGVVICDRWRPYELFEHRQLCHSHLRRDTQALIDRGEPAKAIGEPLLSASNQMFHVWHKFKNGALGDREALGQAMSPIQDQWKALLELAEASKDTKAHALGKDLLRQWDALWTFVTEEGVEPTNNEGERTGRHAVMWRRTSFGNWSDRGACAIARLFTVAGTARRRGVNLVDWLTDACHAAIANVAPPPLRPQPLPP